jgi:phage shock protein E
MKYFKNNLFIIFLLFIIIGLFALILYAFYYSYSGKYLINSNIAKNLVSDKYFDIIIDVRTKLEWNIGHHPNAIHIPASNINKDILNYNNLSKQSNILVYCNTGQRARKAAEKIRKLGYPNTYYITSSYISII